MNDFFRRYLLPGFVFESAVIAGGYATGRELVEFFLPAGPWGGVLGMIVSMLFWSAVLMVSFELARMAKAYDYRSFFKLLLGRGWFLFEIAYFLLMIIILAVMGAAAGEITHDLFGLPKLIGSMSMIAATGLMLFYSTTAIEKFLTLSVGYLYLVYIVFFIWSFVAFGDRIEAAFAAAPVGDGWFKAGITYAGYNVATIPAVLFCIRHLTRRREAMVAGLLGGPLGMLPGVLFFIAMVGYQRRNRQRRAALGVPARQDRRTVVRVGVPDRGAADAGRHRRRDAARDQRARGEGLRGTAEADAARDAPGDRHHSDGDLRVRGRRDRTRRSDRQRLRLAHVRLHRAADHPGAHRRRVADHKAAWRFASTRCRRKKSASVIVDLTRFGILRQP